MKEELAKIPVAVRAIILVLFLLCIGSSLASYFWVSSPDARLLCHVLFIGSGALTLLFTAYASYRIRPDIVPVAGLTLGALLFIGSGIAGIYGV